MWLGNQKHRDAMATGYEMIDGVEYEPYAIISTAFFKIRRVRDNKTRVISRRSAFMQGLSREAMIKLAFDNPPDQAANKAYMKLNSHPPPGKAGEVYCDAKERSAVELLKEIYRRAEVANMQSCDEDAWGFVDWVRGLEIE